MKVVKKDKMADDTKIQIENWNNDYKWISKNSTVACYPISKDNIDSDWCNAYPQRGKSFRYQLQFRTEKEAEMAYMELIKGKKKLVDYISNYDGNIKKDDIIRCIQ